MRCTSTRVIGLLFLSVLSASSLRSQTVDTLVILHTSDPHVIYSLNAYHHIFANTLNGSRGSIDSLQRFFTATTIREGADAVVITGDVLACYEGQTSTGRMLAGQVEQWRSLFDQCPVPLYLILGNHDISTYTIHDADSTIVTSQTGVGRARASWIRNIPCFVDGTYYAREFRVGAAKYQLIFLDDSYSLHDGSRMLEKTQLDWLNERMQEAGDDPVIIFHHMYFSVGDVNSDGVYFNNKKPVDWPSEKQCSEGFLKVLNEHWNIRALIVGHGHENVFEKIHFPSGHGIYQIETGSVTEGHDNWRVLQLTENSIIVSTPGSRKPQIAIEVHEKGTENVRNQ